MLKYQAFVTWYFLFVINLLLTIQVWTGFSKFFLVADYLKKYISCLFFYKLFVLLLRKVLLYRWNTTYNTRIYRIKQSRKQRWNSSRSRGLLISCNILQFIVEYLQGVILWNLEWENLAQIKEFQVG